jgi:hypothetical protein
MVGDTVKAPLEDVSTIAHAAHGLPWQVKLGLHVVPGGMMVSSFVDRSGLIAAGADAAIGVADKGEEALDDALHWGPVGDTFGFLDRHLLGTESAEHYLARLRASRAKLARETTRKWKQSEEYRDWKQHRAEEKAAKAAEQAQLVAAAAQRRADGRAALGRFRATHDWNTFSPLFMGQTTSQAMAAAPVKPKRQPMVRVMGGVKVTKKVAEAMDRHHYDLHDRS